MDAEQKNNKRRWVIIALSVAVVAVVFVRLAHNKRTAEALVYRYDNAQPVSVAVDTVRLEPLGEARSYVGLFEPDRESKVSAEVQGKIAEVLVNVGCRVSQGQPLVQLDNTLLRLQLQGVEVQISGLQSDVDRYTVLAKADAVQGVQLEKAQLGLRAAQVQRATLQEQIAKTTIRAPFAGIVTAKFNEAGAFASPGVPLVQLTDIATLRFTNSVPEADINGFKEGQAWRVSADALPGIPLEGTVVLVGAKADPANNYPVQLRVKNAAEGHIRAGMFGRVYLHEGEQQQGVLVATNAVMMEQGRAEVYVLKDGKAVRHGVSTGTHVGDRLEITHGLAPGDVVVTAGFIDLRDGANVVVQ